MGASRSVVFNIFESDIQPQMKIFIFCKFIAFLDPDVPGWIEDQVWDSMWMALRDSLYPEFNPEYQLS